MKLILLILTAASITACGQTDKKRTYIIQGEEMQCTVIDQAPCGLTLACDKKGIFECVQN